LHNPVEDKNAGLEDVSRGRRFFNSIYGKVAGRVIESLGWGHPNLVDCALKLIVRHAFTESLGTRRLEADRLIFLLSQYTPVLSDLRILQDPLDSSLLCLVLCFSSDLPPQTKVRPDFDPSFFLVVLLLIRYSTLTGSLPRCSEPWSYG